MERDDLLLALGRQAREDDVTGGAELPAVWDRLAAGELSPAEEAELAQRAATDPETAALYQAFRPLGPEFQARVVAAIQAQAAEPAEPAPKLAPVVEFPRSRALWPWLSAAGLAAAAVGAFLLIRPAGGLPPYELELTGGVRSERGSAPGGVCFHPGGQVTLDLRPATAVYGDLEVEVTAQVGEGEPEVLVQQAKKSPAGALRVITSLPTALPAGATGTLTAVVCRPNAPVAESRATKTVEICPSP